MTETFKGKVDPKLFQSCVVTFLLIQGLTYSIQFNSLLLLCQVNSYKANYRHSTVYILVIKYSQIIIVLLILIHLKQIKS
jgi:hypothetical protein